MLPLSHGSRAQAPTEVISEPSVYAPFKKHVFTPPLPPTLPSLIPASFSHLLLPSLFFPLQLNPLTSSSHVEITSPSFI